MPPRVTVLMTTYNGSRFIGASIDSILAQSFTDFELLVVDDGSTDGTIAVIERHADPRLRLLRMPANGGIVAARNAGFAAATSPYIAALDHDDLADPDRLARQVAYLDSNPATVLVGTEVRIDDNGHLRTPDHPSPGDPLAMRWQLLIDNPLTWSSVMFRAETVRALGTFMRADYEPADDFDFYHRMLTRGDIARIGEVLTTYRYHSANTSHATAARLNRNAARVLESAYAPWLHAAAAPAAEAVIRHLSDRHPAADRATLRHIGQTLTDVLAGFSRDQRLQSPDRLRLAAIAGQSWWRCIRAAVRSGNPSLITEHAKPTSLAAAFAPGWRDIIESLAIGTVRGLRRRP